MITAQQRAEFFSGYLMAALWSSTDTKPGGTEEEMVELDDYEWAEGQDEALMAEALKFIEQHGALLVTYTEQRGEASDGSTAWECAGHDFWLNRNGHGCGFWDRGCGEVGDQLSKLVGWQTEYPEIDLYLGDDEKVYAAGFEKA